MLIAHQPPWHMWGNSVQTRELVANEIGTQQIVKINYGRPETWHWYFGARIVQGPDAQAPGSAVMEVYWDLTIGIGRSMSPIQQFEFYSVVWLTSAPVTQHPIKYSTSVIGPVRDQSNSLEPPNLISQIVAQDIQLSARVRLTNAVVAGTPLVAELTAMFSPVTHVRPDWMLLDRDVAEQFPGGEIGGR